MASTQRKYKLIISGIALTVFVVFYLFIVSNKTPDLSVGYILTVIPPIVGSIFLLFISSKNDSPIPITVSLLFAFLLITGNAYQTVIAKNSQEKTLLLNVIALCFAVCMITGYVFFIKKRVLSNKKGYQLAMIIVSSIIVFLFLLLFVFGSNIGGARLWLRIGSFTLELSEIIKFLFFLLLALLYNSNINVKKKIIIGASALTICSVCFALLNEFGTVIILFSVYLISFYVHIRSRYSALMIGGFIVILTIALAVIFGTHEHIKEASGFFAEKLNKIYSRLTLEDTDQMKRALQGMINGGLFGASMNYIIDVYSIEADFALAGISQYFGLVIMLLCIVFACGIMYLVYICGRDDELNNRSRYKLSYILTVAIATQVILSLSGNIGLPVAGVGMPGISAGGTQMMILYTEIAFIVYGIQTDSSLEKQIKHNPHKNIRRSFYVEDKV